MLCLTRLANNPQWKETRRKPSRNTFTTAHFPHELDDEGGNRRAPILQSKKRFAKQAVLRERRVLARFPLSFPPSSSLFFIPPHICLKCFYPSDSSRPFNVVGSLILLSFFFNIFKSKGRRVLRGRPQHRAQAPTSPAAPHRHP